MARILVIEDDLELRGVLTALLDSEAHQVVGVSSGEEALEVAKEASFDLVIADIRMEGMSGLDAIERVKQDDSEMKSLVITGYASEEDSIRAVSLGVEAYLKKPFSLDDLLNAVNRALQDLEAERAAQNQRIELTASFEWALTALSKVVEQSPDSSSLSGLGPLVSSLCRKLDVVDSIRSSAVVTALYLGVREPLSPLFSEAPPFPRAVVRALEALDEWYDGSGQPRGLSGSEIPLESRIAQVAHAAICEAPSLKTAKVWLETKYPGRFDPGILAILEAPEKTLDRGEGLYAQRSLLTLGKAFEEAGNLASARQAFGQVLEHHNNRFALEACLGITRISAREKKEPPGKVLKHAQKAIKLAEYVGAAPFGWCGLELALLLHEVGLPEAGNSMLERAEQAFVSLKLSIGLAAIRLANYALYGRGDPEEIERAFEAIFRSNLAERVDELMLRTLPRALDEECEALHRVATKMVRDYPQHVLECLYRKSLTSRAKLTVAQVQAKFILPYRDAVLERLAVDKDPRVQQAAEEIQASDSGDITVPALRFFSLGPMSAFRANERIQETMWRSQKAKYLLAMLAAAGSEPVSEDKILDSFWPGSAKKGRNCLYWATSTLRNALKVDGFELDSIVRTSSGLQINPEIPLWHDLHQFEKLAQSVKRGETSAYNIEEFLHVLDLYRGPYLEGAYFDWVIDERHRLEVQATELLTRFVEWTLQKQRFSNTLDYALRLIDIDPSNQDAHVAIMKAWLGMGKPREALEHFDNSTTMLKLEYREEPSIELLEYRQRALVVQDDTDMPHLR